MNKYNLNWQLTRVQNRKLNLTDKLHKIRIFLSAYPSPENKERVLNYLLGLEKGYKTIEQRAMVRSTYNFLKDKQCNEADVEINIENVETKDLILLYKDLFKRNEKWLNNNYRHEDQNKFLEFLYKELSKRGEKLDKNFDIYPIGKNKQKFLY